MPIFQRSFATASDQAPMAALARQFFSDNLHVLDLPYRFSSWAFDQPDNIRLWFEGKQLIAWAALQTPFWTIDYVCHPAFEAGLHPEILAWADHRARAILNTPYGHPCWFVMAFAGQAQRRADLERAGFKCQAEVGEDSWSKVLMRRVSQAPVKIYEPPSGFVVRPLAGEQEVAAYVELHRAVFESKNMTEPWRNRARQHPDYRPDLDLVVAAPDGRLAAFCVGWLSSQTAQPVAGHIEPLGCHQDFRRYALGRVALAANLQKLQQLGAQAIYVETDNYRNTAFQLYEAFDFVVIQDVLVYRQDYAAPLG